MLYIYIYTYIHIYIYTYIHIYIYTYIHIYIYIEIALYKCEIYLYLSKIFLAKVLGRRSFGCPVQDIHFLKKFMGNSPIVGFLKYYET